MHTLTHTLLKASLLTKTRLQQAHTKGSWGERNQRNVPRSSICPFGEKSTNPITEQGCQICPIKTVCV